MGAFGYWFAAAQYQELRTGCIFFTAGAAAGLLILLADRWWWGVVGNLLRELTGRNSTR
jgi:hypothetical protein